MPACNEEKTVVSTIFSLLALEYKDYEIIVVDDGSEDATGQCLQEAFHMQQIELPIYRLVACKSEESVYQSLEQSVPITLIRKDKGGKADALNLGLSVAASAYFLVVDADCVLQPDSLTEIMKLMTENDSVIAVGGCIRPVAGTEAHKGRERMLTVMQTLEYARAFEFSRILLDHLHGNVLISGALGLFRRDLVIAVDGYDMVTASEDMELTLKLQKYCVENEISYRIRYAPNAVCWTHVPKKLKNLRKQRVRWQIGLLQCIWKYRCIFGNKKFHLLGRLIFPYVLLREALAPYVAFAVIGYALIAWNVDLFRREDVIRDLSFYAAISAGFTTFFYARHLHRIGSHVAVRTCVGAFLLGMIDATVYQLYLILVRVLGSLGIIGADWGKKSRVVERKLF